IGRDPVVEPVLMPEELAKQRGVAVLLRVVERADVAAGAERLVAGTIDHHGADRLVGRPFHQLLVERTDHIQCQRVQRLGTIQRGLADAVGDLEQNVGEHEILRTHQSAASWARMTPASSGQVWRRLDSPRLLLSETGRADLSLSLRARYKCS